MRGKVSVERVEMQIPSMVSTGKILPCHDVRVLHSLPLLCTVQLLAAIVA